MMFRGEKGHSSTPLSRSIVVLGRSQTYARKKSSALKASSAWATKPKQEDY